MDTDVIVIKSEDISDTEQSQNGGNGEDMDDDDEEDCLSPKDMPEVCLEEEDEELNAADLRQRKDNLNLKLLQHTLNHQQQQQQQKQDQNSSQSSNNQPEVTIQNVGGIRVGSIGSMANLKALQNGVNSAALSITATSSNGNNSNGNGNAGSANQNSNNNNYGSAAVTPSARQTSAEQQLLLSGLGLSAVQHPVVPSVTNVSSARASPNAVSALPLLQRVPNNSNNNSSNSALHNLSSNHNAAGSSNNANTNALTASQILLHMNGAAAAAAAGHHHSPYGRSSRNNNHHRRTGAGEEILNSLAIEERKRKIDLLNAQIDYWKTLTKKLNSSAEHFPNPSCMCHFPGKVNGLHTPSNSS